MTLGTCSVAVPILDHGGRPVAAVGARRAQRPRRTGQTRPTHPTGRRRHRRPPRRHPLMNIGDDFHWAECRTGGRSPSRPTIVAMRTQVGIVGSGPSGLLLAQILAQHGIESVIVESRSREYVEARIRAGVIEHGAVDVLTEYGVGERLHKEGLRHDGVYLQWPGHRERIDFVDSCGQSVWIYGQTQLTKDLVNARLAADQQILWEVSQTRIEDADTAHPRITFRDAGGHPRHIDCDYVAGCDGFHGVSRQTIPESVRTVAQRAYPFSWLGILADVPPSTDELIYAWHPDGFALHSMRSAEVSRLYLQIAADDDVTNWPDERVWEALSTRFALDGWTLRSGPTLSAHPCAGGGCSSPATRRTSCRQPAPRASTSPSPTSTSSPPHWFAPSKKAATT